MMVDYTAGFESSKVTSVFTQCGAPAERRQWLQLLACVVALGLLKSSMPPFMMRIPTDADASRLVETCTGIGFAILGAWLGSHASSSLRANFLTCAVVAIAFSLLRRAESAGVTLRNPHLEKILTKFVGSFCGAASGFAAMLSDATDVAHQHPRLAVLDVLSNWGVAILFTGVYYAFDREGLDVCAHSMYSFCA